MKAADHYLTITPHSDDRGPPPRWSSGCDAVETGYGDTVALHEEIKLVLEGVFSTDARPPISFVLDVLGWCRQTVSPSEVPDDTVWERLRPLVVAAKPTARNLGRLIAFLCEGLPPAVVTPAWAELSKTLELRRMFGERANAHPLPGPPLSRHELATRVDARLRSVTNRQLVGLLLTGERELPDPAPVAQALLTFPQRLAAVLAEFRSRDRLVGAAFLAPLIDGALALPPRRPTPDRLPQGGYADVTTRGVPDRLLPSQFALDADEFIRRFAENELLYFRREEPHAAKTPTRVLLLDQGVRTWGPVRLGLAGAAVAVLMRDPARFAAVSVGTTSRQDFFDPWAVTPAELATRLEASDLTVNPADLLDRAFLQVSDGPRDIVLLTHPRNARELAVRETLLDLPADDRLFLLTLDDAGAAELLEADENGTRSVRRFRVDLAGAEAVKVRAKPTPPARALPAWSARPWTGDVEPVAFPFRAGLVADVDQHITFDADAKWVVVLGRDGTLHAKRVNSDEPLEVLPRPLWQGKLLGPVQALLPMRDGFALVAQALTASSVTVTQGWGTQAAATEPTVALVDTVAVRYEFSTRRVRCLRLSPTRDLLLLPLEHNRGRGAGGREEDVDVRLVSVAEFGPEAGLVALGLQPTLTALSHSTQSDGSLHAGGALLAKSVTGLSLHVSGRQSLYFAPTAEGKPILQDAVLSKAILAADTLAVVASEGKSSSLWVMNVNDGAVLHQQGNVWANHALTLSPDGRWLARQNTPGRNVEVRAVNGGAVVRLPTGGYHNNAVVFHLSADALVVQVGRYQHRLWLNCVPFGCDSRVDAELPLNVVASAPERSPTAYDSKRFEQLVEAGPWVACYDRWGQVVLLNAVGNLVMHVCVCRGQWAVVLPDGTRCGSAALLGGAPTPDAERLIGEALWLAAVGAGGV